jgi:ABC-type transport system substrate-binding protein
MYKLFAGLLAAASALALAGPAQAAMSAPVQYETAASPAGFDPAAVQDVQYYHHWHHWHHWHHRHWRHWHRGPVVVINPR